MEDRNGNLVQLSTPQIGASNTVYTVTDSAGRSETLNISDNFSSDHQDVITYAGYNAQPKSITIKYSLLGDNGVLASGESLETYQCLFPELNGSSSTTFNPAVVSSIVLADGSSYAMQYNSYGELVQLTLPTGGKYTYRYAEASGCSANTGSGVLALQNSSGYRIARPLVERDELSDGMNITSRLIFSVSGTDTGLDANHASRPGATAEAKFQDGAGKLFRDEKHYFWGNSLSTAAPVTDPTQSAPWWEGIEFKTVVSDSSGPLQTKEMVYGQRSQLRPNETVWFDPQADTAPAHDPQLCQVNTKPAGMSQSSGLSYTYADAYNNVTFQYEYDYGSAPPIGAACPAQATQATRTTYNTYMNAASYVDPSVNLVSLLHSTAVNPSTGNWSAYTYSYDEVAPSDEPGIVSHDAAYGTGYNVRGNATDVSRWASDVQGGMQIYTGYRYDVAGNIVSITDQNGNAATLQYADPNNSFAHPTTVTVGNPPASLLNPAAPETSAYEYDWSTGKLTKITDPNKVENKNIYGGPLDQLTETMQAVGTTSETHTLWMYPSPTQVKQCSDQVSLGEAGACGEGSLRQDVIYDGLGRVAQQVQYEDASHTITTTTGYDALGRVASVSNPLRAGDAMLGSGYLYDGLGRVATTTYADGSQETVTYQGDMGMNLATWKDAAGRKRQFTFDGLGRLTTVVENMEGAFQTPSYTTTYGYDPNDKLIRVTQGGQTRTFNYSTLGWLDNSTQPESGTIRYGYDGVGNLGTRTDGRGVQINYSYDNLNRLTDIKYPGGGTSNVHLTYDDAKQSNALGRLTQVANGNAGSSYGYDELGRVAASSQTTGGQTYAFVYRYNLAGALKSETYPSGRVVTTGYDGANRASSVTGQLGTQQTPLHSWVRAAGSIAGRAKKLSFRFRIDDVR